MPPADVRLTSDQRAKLNRVRDLILERHALLDRAERAGMDVTELRAELNDAEQLRVNLLAEFGVRTGS